MTNHLGPTDVSKVMIANFGEPGHVRLMKRPLPPGKRLPFVHIDRVLHYGVPSPRNGVVEATYSPLTWLFEPGLFPVSRDSYYWELITGPHGDHFELTRTVPFRFLVAEETLSRHSKTIARAAARCGYLNGGSLTLTAFRDANLINGCTAPGAFAADRAVLEVCLALLAQRDTSIDGLWWTTTTPQISKVQRGGFFQRTLPLAITQLSAAPPALPDPTVQWERSKAI